MIAGALTLDGFAYAVGDAERQKIENGKPIGERDRVKVLALRDLASGLQLRLTFTKEEFEKFVEVMRESESSIIKPPNGFQPKDTLTPFLRSQQ